MSTMRIMRSNYDKAKRCPVWSGPGYRRSYGHLEGVCDGGTLWHRFDKRAWKWRAARCPKCGTLTLPYVLRWLEPETYRYKIRNWVLDFRSRLP